MIESTVSLEQATADAQRYMRSGNHPGARAHLLRALTQTYAPERVYAQAVTALRQACEAMEDWRGAVTCAWYQKDGVGAGLMGRRLPPQDRARSVLLTIALGASGDRESSIAHEWRQASDLFLQAGQTARAAVCLEHAKDWREARKLWARLSEWTDSNGTVDRYVKALVSFNLSRCSRAAGDEKDAHQTAVRAVYDLQEAADTYEAVGQRERAFDCYQVLVSLGKDSRVIEHALEGYVNLVRILREDGLSAYAIQSYGESMAFLGGNGELAAASTMARELAQYARRQGATALANWAVLEEARLASASANSLISSGAPAELAENALLSAAQSYAELGQYARVREVFAQLAGLPLEDARRAHYRRVVGRYANMYDERVSLSSVHVDQNAGINPVWHADVIEWEQRGSALEAASDVLVDPTNWSDVTLRRSLLVRFAALDLENIQRRREPTTQAIVGLVDRIGATEMYSMLSPLEHFMQSPDVAVRDAVVRTLGNFLYKRTLPTLRKALHDPSPDVRNTARESISSMRFPHALEPLVRIYREEQSPLDRQAALEALMMVDNEQVISWLIEELSHAAGERLAVFEHAMASGASLAFSRAVYAQIHRFPSLVVKRIEKVLPRG